MKHMYLICALIAFPFVLSSCRSQSNVVATEKQNERIETRYERIFIKDTVYLEIPAQSAERTTADSSSFLENDYAASNARINPDGTLYHDLYTKPQLQPTEIDKEIERKDSIVYREREVEVPVIIEKDLTEWQEFRLKWFGALVAVLLALLAWTFRNPLKNLIALIRRFI